MNVSSTAMLCAGLLLLGLAGDAGFDAPDTIASPVLAAVAVDADAVDGNETIEAYCVRCHSEQRQRGGLVLEDFDVENATQH
ncbi:MAG: hypothetical protein P8L45_05705, partial [Longimicrobiales bacterium]|nr:hypothetical protein [Longimicrobiales bacterium]